MGVSQELLQEDTGLLFATLLEPQRLEALPAHPDALRSRRYVALREGHPVIWRD